MSFDIALTGLNAATQELEIISNNIANGGTAGFKRSRAEFADVYAASDLGVVRNATGEGVQVTNTRQQFSQGNITFTENNLDLSISGQGFFRLDDNGSATYTRAGQFGLDRDGNIASNSGAKLVGYLSDGNGGITPVLGPIKIDRSDLPPKPTENIELTLNLDATIAPPAVAFDVNNPLSYNFSTAATVIDSLGTSHITNTYFRNTGPNNWESFMYVEGNQVATNTFAFNAGGTLDSINGTPPTTVTIAGFQPDPNVNPVDLNIDYTNITQFTNPFGVNNLSIDGHASGRLTDLDIDNSGVIFGRYNNGESLAMGQIAMANFANVNGLRQRGDTSWSETFASGAPAVGTPGSASLGLINSGALEESNVDVTKELVDMIGAQRNFQANAQVISVADTLTQTVINIRR